MEDRIKLGDTVAFNRAFLDCHARFYRRIGDASGAVTALHQLKTGPILADIDWDVAGLPKRVNVKNLIATSRTSLSG